MDLKQLLSAITPDIYARLTQAVELGRWPDGSRLSASQRELCLQAIIAYDVTHKPEDQRVGYIHPPVQPRCDGDRERSRDSQSDDASVTEPALVKWQH